MSRLDRSNEGCLIDESRNSVRLGLKGSERGDEMTGKARDGNKGGELWSSDLGGPGQGNSLRLGNQNRRAYFNLAQHEAWMRGIWQDRTKNSSEA